MGPVKAIRDQQGRTGADAAFGAVFELVAAAICEAGTTGPFVEVSAELCELLGLEKDQLLRKTLPEIIADPEGRDAILLAQQRLVHGEIRSYSREVRLATEARRNIRASIIINGPVTGPHGRPTFAVVFRGGGEWRRAGATLWASSALARLVIDALATHICVLDEAGTIVAVNRAWREFAFGNGTPSCGSIGSNYLDICVASGERGFADGAAIAAGIRSVISGEADTFERDIVYETAAGPQWFVGRVVRLRWDASTWIVFKRQPITTRKTAELEVRAARDSLNLAVRAAEVGLWEWNLLTNELRYSREWKEQLGYDETEIGDSLNEWARLVHPDYVAPTLALAERCARDPTVAYQTEFPMRHKDGSYRWFLSTASVLRNEDGTAMRLVGSHVDITARKQAEEALRERNAIFHQLTENLADVFWLSSVDKRQMHFVSPAYERIWGRSCQELYRNPTTWLDAIHPEDRERIERAALAKQAGGSYDEEFRIVRPDGEVRWIRDRGFPVTDAAGNVFRIAGIARDVTERKQAEEQLIQLARYDKLTGLPNRTLFYDELQHALLNQRNGDKTLAVMLLDLDRFKVVNDTLAHAYGDKLLKQVGERLSRSVRAGDVVGRLGGDEFGVILPGLESPAEAEAVAEQIVKSFAEPFDLDGHEVFMSASIGLTFFTSAYEGADTMIMNADVAMYSAKRQGRNTYQHYSKEMHNGALRRLQLETELRRAVEHESFVVHYQPKVGLRRNRIAGLEALLRWRSREGELIPPGQFVPLLEQTGLIEPVGRWLLRAVCGQLAEWGRTGIPLVPVAVNVAAPQLQQKAFVAEVAKALEEHGTDPRLIEFEITESSLMEDPDTAIAILEEIRSLGVRIAIDDFGTGYSSLSYLKRFPLDALKIDRSFVRDAITDPNDAAIARSVTALGRAMGLKIIAEGVETAEQLAFLRNIGCEEAQGYLFSPPVDAAACAEQLKDGGAIHQTLATIGGTSSAVLIVDNHPGYRDLLIERLRSEGLSILTAASSEEAFDVLATNRVGAVVTDEQVPTMGGIELLRRVKRIYPRVRRVVLSSVADSRIVMDAINDGAVHRFFLKGKDEQRLRAELPGLLALRGTDPKRETSDPQLADDTITFRGPNGSE